MPQANNVTSVQYGNNVVERMPPHSVEAEEAVLGSILIDPEAMERVKRVLCGADFFIVKNQWVFEAALAIHEHGDPLDFVTITRELEAREQLVEAGGATYISQLLNNTPTAIHAEGYARIVLRNSLRRQALNHVSEVAQEIYDESTDETDLFERASEGFNAVKLAALSRLTSRKITQSATEILDAVYPPPVWFIENYLSVGLGIVSGKQKIGKSWLMMQVSGAIGMGRLIFNLKTLQHRVLYLALEDPARRLQERMNIQGWNRSANVDYVNFKDFMECIGNLGKGGTDRLIHLIEEDGYEFVVIDTFNKAWAQFMKSGEINDSGIITRSLSRLQDFANSTNRAIMIVDHHGKAVGYDGGDIWNDMLGSAAKGGTIDNAWGLYRERGKDNALLIVDGRDIAGEQRLMLEFAPDTCMWQYTGDGQDYGITNKERQIIEFVKRHGRSTPLDIISATNQSKSHVSERCNKLVKDGELFRGEDSNGVFYALVCDVDTVA